MSLVKNGQQVRVGEAKATEGIPGIRTRQKSRSIGFFLVDTRVILLGFPLFVSRALFWLELYVYIFSLLFLLLSALKPFCFQ